MSAEDAIRFVNQRERNRFRWYISAEFPSWVEWEIYAGIRRVQRVLTASGDYVYKYFLVDSDSRRWQEIASDSDFHAVLNQI